MIQRTLIALYGDKSPELEDFVAQYQGMAAAALGEAFRPYEVEQVHVTILGLEHQPDAPGENANFRQHRGQSMTMDIPGFLVSLRKSAALPFQVKIGGFGELDRPFLSRGASPYERSFSIQGDKAVVMGWPWRASSGARAEEYPQTLDNIRRSAQGFGILHAYHRLVVDMDNDLYFRIGLIERSAVGDQAVVGLERQVRRVMSSHHPLMLRIGINDLSVAAYEDERLPLGSTEIRPVADPGLDSDFL